MSEPLKIVIIDEADQYVVRIGGEIDLGNCQQVADAIKPLLPRHKTIAIDLSRVSFMDSSGLRVFLKVKTWVSDHAKTLMLRNPSDQLRRLLVAAGLEPMLDD